MEERSSNHAALPCSVVAVARLELIHGAPGEACAQIGELLAAHPGEANVYHLQALVEAHAGAFDRAVHWLELATESCPDMIQWHGDLAVVQGARGHWAAAAGSFSKVLKQFPNDVRAGEGLGRALVKLGRCEEAIEHLQDFTSIRSGAFAPLLALARALAAAERFEEAVAVLKQADRIKPDHVETHKAVARIYSRCGQHQLALTYWKRVLGHAPENPEATSGLIHSGWQLGDLAATLDLMERLISEGRATQELHAFWLYTKLHDGRETAESIRRRCEAFSSKVTPPFVRPIAEFRRTLHARQTLRVGYLSGEFVSGAPFNFLLPLIGNHTKNLFEIFLYHTRGKDDQGTEWYRRAGNWRDCRRLDDNAVRARIEQDSVDILVDTSGFFPENRLRIFAGRAAPIQISYPNCPTTTGIAEMDYIFTDRWTCRQGQEKQYTEHPLFLPSGYLAYAPPPGAPELTPLPASRNGYLTFGFFQRLLKANTNVWNVIAQILHTCPGSRLLIQSYDPALDDPESSSRLCLLGEFADRGIDASRLIIVGARPHRETMACIAQADIALDSFPYQGQTTTCECLWQGVPVIALSGNYHVARVGSGILARVGLGHLATQSANEYAQCAVGLSQDLAALGQLRAGMRQRLRDSTLLDGKNLAREVEAAYRRLWQAWCGGETRLKPDAQ